MVEFSGNISITNIKHLQGYYVPRCVPVMGATNVVIPIGLRANPSPHIFVIRDFGLGHSALHSNATRVTVTVCLPRHTSNAKPFGVAFTMRKLSEFIGATEHAGEQLCHMALRHFGHQRHRDDCSFVRGYISYLFTTRSFIPVAGQTSVRHTLA